MLIDINNLILLKKYAIAKGCTTDTVKKAIKKGFIEAVKIEHQWFIKLNRESYDFYPKRLVTEPEYLPEPKKPLFIDLDKLISLNDFAKIKGVSYYKAFNRVVERQQIPHIRIERRIFVIIDEKAIMTTFS